MAKQKKPVAAQPFLFEVEAVSKVRETKEDSTKKVLAPRSLALGLNGLYESGRFAEYIRKSNNFYNND